MHSRQLPNKRYKYMHYLSFNLLYIGGIIRPIHIRIKEHFNTCASSFHWYLIKCKNNDYNFPIEIEAIVRNTGNHRCKVALLIAESNPQINSRSELNTEYIIN